ncbi:MAG: glycoside hydrolase family 43 protein [Eubacterium sp.]|jgi:xylan 1,4-beta-xylosidase|nr:glycoside hydrolase family 43 protein [Eubacterium sp.]
MITKIKNPILRGFNPDPNIVKAGDTYYIVVSSFEWLPGVRVYSSKDLVNWEHETDILTSQVNLRGNPRNCSVWAPQLSYADGLFWLIFTDVKSVKRPFKDCHNYLITAPSVHGPWKAPVYLNSSGFDPSLFHDTDGRKWLLNEVWDYRIPRLNRSAGILLQEFDPVCENLIGKVYKIFDGTHLAKTEAPHIYRHGGYYYLLTAEGGTGEGHSVTVCRSKSITGPYELDPKFPMLTASDKPDSILRCSGHGSLVENGMGNWYMAYLCTRPLNGHAILGRETAIQEVIFTDDGWLRLKNGGNGPLLETDVVTEKETKQTIITDFRDDFNNFKNGLKKEWNTLRILADESWCDLKSRPGHLRLVSGESPQSLFDHHILAIRQRDFCFSAETKMSYSPESFLQMAGLILYLNDGNYLYVYITFDEAHGRSLRIMRCVNDEFELNDEIIPLSDGEVSIKFETIGSGETGRFYYSVNSSDWQTAFGEENLLFLSGGYTGNFIGFSISDAGNVDGSYADFKYFEYKGFDEV